MENTMLAVVVLFGLFAVTLIIAKAFFSGAASDEEVERRLMEWVNREKRNS